MNSPTVQVRMAIVAMSAAWLSAMPATADAAGPGLFARMAGGWSGGGRIVFSDGRDERIRCRANFADEAGAVLEQHLRCASDSYNFDIGSTVAARGDQISGNWNEATRNVAGQIEGRVSGNRIQAHVQAGPFQADLALSVTGNALRITLVPQGNDVREIEVTLRRG
jgi:hypothetical protein